MNPPKNFVAKPFSYHQEIDIKIETLTNRGLGLARVDNWVVMVPFVIPGERVKVRVYRNYSNYSEADLVEVLEPSPKRVTSACSLFGACGGCQYQHIAYEEQLRWKQTQVKELFKQMADIEFPIESTIGSPKEYNYRSKITPHYPKPGEGKFPIGFLKQGTRQTIVDVPQCPIAMEGINKALPVERDNLFNAKKKKRKGGTLLLRQTLEGVTTDNNAIVSERVGKVVFQFPAGEFFQNNPFILPLLVDFVIEEAESADAKYLIDAYCGVGMFALCGSKDFEKCMGIEVNANAIKWANANARINQITNCEFLIGEAQDIFSDISFPSEDCALVIDPPRKGCDTAFIEQVAKFKPKRLVYVSCEPSTQVRDVKGFLAAGYKITKIQPFDLFPQTRHIENVVVMDLA